MAGAQYYYECKRLLRDDRRRRMEAARLAKVLGYSNDITPTTNLGQTRNYSHQNSLRRSDSEEYKRTQVSVREERRGIAGVSIGQDIDIAAGNNLARLKHWQQQLVADSANHSHGGDGLDEGVDREGCIHRSV